MSYHDKHLDEFNARVIAHLEQGLPPWLQDWAPGHAPLNPWNPATGKQYAAENALSLMLAQGERNLSDSAWLTYKQASHVGGQVAKGADGVRIKVFEPKTEQEKQAALAQDPAAYIGPTIKYAWVFPTSVVRGLPKELSAPPHGLADAERHTLCEKMLRESGVKIAYDRNQAYYQPSTDTIHMPPRETYATADAFYGDLIVQLCHATGHTSRLNRDQSALWQTPEYAPEALIAHTAAYFIASRLGTGHNATVCESYRPYWTAALQADNRLLSKAAAQAEKICTSLGVKAEQTEALPQVERQQRAPQQGASQEAPAQESAPTAQAPAPAPAAPTKGRAQATRQRRQRNDQDQGVAA
ncbi:MAG TPA: zincin-like metallopeptidase domain-containing protein [Dyella sp.]|uniref:zincin-like metallopeptidase domain-containing protein n=1 Tax=Dyella sp. TaxID=1869338 RepID=UPI002C894CFB|nr:zincin-like metallopeptidase domain-containing protein [Dyella sp.]HTV84232.1 zincin-like metallopeptidase domain-containing protein [Dyella sp.]